MNILKKIYCRVFQAAFKLAIPYLPYREPKLYYSLEDIPQICSENHVQKLLIVTDQQLVRLGLCDRLQQVMAKAGIQYAVYADTVPNPTIENVEAARSLYVHSGCQGFISLGGGSAMDCSKAAACRIARPNTPVAKMGGILRVWKKLPLLIAIPTTAGTGSETTLAAVVTDQQKHHKYAIMDFPLIPRVAILDYHLTVNLPPHITATTGMDALVHAVEAYIGGSTTNYTRRMAVEAVTLINRHLFKAYTTPHDAHARQGMLRAAFCAGAAFSQSYVGYVHCVAHTLGGQYGIPHGLANAVLLPIVLRKYGTAVYPRLAQLARRSGVAYHRQSDQDAAQQFIAWIQMLNDKMDIPRKLEGIQLQDIPAMARYAEKEGNPLYPVPVLWGRKQLEEIYHLCRI